MNKPRREKIQKVLEILEEVISEEELAYDNMPENIQESEKGEKIEEGLDDLNDVKNDLESILGR